MRLGVEVGPFAASLDADFVRRYAAATADPSAKARTGVAVPPVAIATQIWDAQNEGRAALVSEDLARSATGGVHGEHDVVLHRPIRPGEPLRIRVSGQGASPRGRNTMVTLRYVALDNDDTVVAEQWWTTVYLGVTADGIGDPAPDHAMRAESRDRPVGSYVVDIDDDMARRYAEVSGDWSDHHFDPEAARRSGVDRIFLHGLCTMALCAQGVVHLVADGDPDRLRRVAVRFAAPTFLGERLELHLYDAGPNTYAFEAQCAGANVITHGLAELR